MVEACKIFSCRAQRSLVVLPHDGALTEAACGAQRHGRAVAGAVACDRVCDRARAHPVRSVQRSLPPKKKEIATSILNVDDAWSIAQRVEIDAPAGRHNWSALDWLRCAVPPHICANQGCSPRPWQWVDSAAAAHTERIERAGDGGCARHYGRYL